MKNLCTKILAFILTIVVLNSFSQDDLKYKDVYEFLQTKSQEEAYSQLEAYQRQDPTHANTYYQLANIALQWTKKYDPFTEYSDLKHFAYHANLYFGLALNNIDEKEARKNREYYQYVEIPEGQKKIQYEDIVKDVKNSLAEIDSIKRNVDKIRNNYLGAVNNYNACLEIFLDINQKNNQLKDIYLTADDTLITQIKKLRSHFDSTIIFFDRYKEALAEYPVKDYDQQYEIVPIETYRLHGLTNSDFLQNDIQLWDYKSWVESVLKVINTDIEALRNEIDATVKEMNGMMSLLNLSKDYTRSYDQYKLDKKLVFRIGKYDYQPLILDLLFYNEQKINLIIKAKDPFNDPGLKINKKLEPTAYLNYYYELVNSKLTANKKLTTLENNITDYKVSKYGEFFNRNYNGKKGLLSYIEKEKEEDKAIIDKSLSLLKKYVVFDIENNTNKSQYITYNNTSIPCFTTALSFSNPRPEQYYTLAVKTDEFGNYYLTGYFNPAEGNKKAFVASADSTFKLRWFKDFDYSTPNDQFHNIGMLLELTEDGCISIVHAYNQSDSIASKNAFIRFAYDGEVLNNKNIGGELVPRFFLFDALNEKMLLAYYKEKIEQPDSLYEMVINYTDSTGFRLWESKITFSGDVVDIIRTDENFLLIGNYNKLIDHNNNLVEAGYSTIKTNAFTAYINNGGSVQSVKPLKSEKSYFITQAVKLNSEVVNLLGIKGLRTDGISSIKNSATKIAYQLINVKGDVIYEY